MECEGCKKTLKLDNYLSCHACIRKYDYECLGMKTDQFISLSKDSRANWVCPACATLKRRNKSNHNTPVRHNQIPIIEKSMDTLQCDNSNTNIPLSPMPQPSLISQPQINTVDKFNELLGALQVWRSDMGADMAKMRDDIKDTLTEIQSEMRAIRMEQTTMRLNISQINTEIVALQGAVQCQTDAHDVLKSRVDDVIGASCEPALTAISGLEFKIDTLEQQARQCNVEICNVLERRNENLIGVVEDIGTAIGFQLHHRDIVSVHRVPHAQQGGDKPKNIILKLTTRIQRDNMLSTFRKTKSLMSDRIGIPGTPTKIYMNEHLTIKRKQLFRQCRELAKEIQYKYVWIRNSTVLLRERDDSPAIAIRSGKDLDKLKRDKNVNG